MNPSGLSKRYEVRRLNEADIEAVLRVLSGNPLFFEYHPPLPTRDSILEDMRALPPGMSVEDKLYIGFLDGKRLAAVMDLILGYPEKSTAFIGFFMVDASLQGEGVGSAIIGGCAESLSACGYEKLRLAIDGGNPQSAAFWTKNGFEKTGEIFSPNGRTVFPMERFI